MTVSRVRARQQIQRRIGENFTHQLWEEHGEELRQDLLDHGIDFAVEVARDLLHPERVQDVSPDELSRPSPVHGAERDLPELRRRLYKEQGPRVRMLSFLTAALIMNSRTGQMIDNWRCEHLPPGSTQPGGEALPDSYHLLGLDEVGQWWKAYQSAARRHDRALHDLSPLIARLGYHGVSREEALSLVLSGFPPTVPSLQIRTSPSATVPQVTITLTPAFTVKEVTELLKDWWPQIFPTATSHALTEKHIELVTFVARFSQPGRWEGWAELCRRWNKRWARSKPDWRYSESHADFKRDATREWKQVTGKEWREPTPIEATAKREGE